MLLKDITFVYTLAPRTTDTINESIKSLRKAKIENTIYISAEPGEYKIKDKNFVLKVHKKKKGCFLHYDWILNKYSECGTKYLFIIQDDFVFSDRIQELKDFNDEGFGFYDFFLSDQIFPFINKCGWNDTRFGWSTAGACFLFDTKMIPKIVESFFYQNHKNEYVVKVKNQQVDSCIGETCKLLNLKTFFPSLSYAKHIGESSIGHTDPFFGKFNFAKCELQKFRPITEKITIGIASIPEREEQLKRTIVGLVDQADKIIVGLNNYGKCPERLKKIEKCQVILSDNSKGDAMKFIKVGKFNGYYICCDDDIIYPEDRVQFLIANIEKHNRKAIVGLHGVIVPGTIGSYYHDCKRIHYSIDLSKAEQVHILGTGTIGFHSSTIKLSVKDFKKPNMADIRLGIQAQEQNVPMIAVPRGREIIIQQHTTDSIWNKHRNDDKIQTDICNSIERKQF